MIKIAEFEEIFPEIEITNKFEKSNNTEVIEI